MHTYLTRVQPLHTVKGLGVFSGCVLLTSVFHTLKLPSRSQHCSQADEHNPGIPVIMIQQGEGELFKELQPHFRRWAGGFACLISGPYSTVLPLLDVLSRVGGPVCVDGAHTGRWFCVLKNSPSTSNALGRGPVLTEVHGLGLLVCSCQTGAKE